ncbi:Ger(x)C family spore germination protein [Edaphobacillus lindanitolerans]|uniref:Spore germination protein KC n=1 Tax=Edaphobacillus lindanitolerans TaxID=550447 RepID=A0A1U7PN80_9BACI|nr:Ger(x)C family spore germination protein [Edaphobacillus lindanitolerans]SIT72297.1 spore germination protein KC [Edaphobacillus lindanitolerans]
MIPIKKPLVATIICCCFLTGCWDKRELNEIAIAVAFGIDKSDEGFRVSAQVVVPSAISSDKGAEGTPVLLFQADGETAYEAIRKMTKQVPRKIYPGHLKLLVIGEEMAREGIWDSLDLFVRDWEVRPDFSVVVARDRPASDILRVPTALDTIPANKLFDMLENSSDNWSEVHKMTLFELLADISSDGKDAVLTGILSSADADSNTGKEATEEIHPSARLYFDNLAVFEKDRLVGWLDAEQSKGFNYVAGNIKNTVETISCPEGGSVAIEVTKSDAKIKASFSGGNPEMEIIIKNKGNVGSVQCGLDMKKPESIHILDNLFEKKLTGIIEETVKETQSRGRSDIFGFGQTIHRSHPDKWKSLKGEWDEHGFENVPVKVKVEMNIRMTGTLLNPL